MTTDRKRLLASVAAVFEVGPGHPARTILEEREIEAEDDVLVLRRLLGSGLASKRWHARRRRGRWLRNSTAARASR